MTRVLLLLVLETDVLISAETKDDPGLCTTTVDVDDRRVDVAEMKDEPGLCDASSVFDSVAPTASKPNNLPGVSLHYVKKKVATAAWSQVRPALLKAAIEENAMPVGQCCINCPESANHRCIQCAPWAYHCDQCC